MAILSDCSEINSSSLILLGLSHTCSTSFALAHRTPFLRSYPLPTSHKKKGQPTANLFLMAILERFERPTHSLEGCCSIQLSYRTMVYAYTKNYFNCQEKRTKFSFLSYKYSSIDFPKRKISSASDK